MTDELYGKAVEAVRSTDAPSVAGLRVALDIGFSRATKLMDAMEFHGVVRKKQNDKRRYEVVDFDDNHESSHLMTERA